jgi:hypothetical protein
MDYVINCEKMNFADASSHERELNFGRDSDQPLNKSQTSNVTTNHLRLDTARPWTGYIV